MALGPSRVEYVCPVCDRKTILTSRDDWDALVTGGKLKKERARIAEIRGLGLDAMLDERSLCVDCRVEMNPVPKTGDLYLHVTLNDKTTRTKLNDDDLPKLIAFLKGKLVWPTFNDGEKLLKPEIPRIRAMLGLDENDSSDTALEAANILSLLAATRVEYECNKCGVKDAHTSEDAIKETNAYRKGVRQLRELGVDAVLKERALCEACNKEATGLSDSTVVFYLDVQTNGKIIHTSLRSGDLPKLLAHARKQTTWRDNRGVKNPLEPELPRIRKLLGLDTEETKSTEEAP